MKEAPSTDSANKTPDVFDDLADIVRGLFGTTTWEFHPRSRTERPSLKVSWGEPADKVRVR